MFMLNRLAPVFILFFVIGLPLKGGPGDGPYDNVSTAIQKPEAAPRPASSAGAASAAAEASVAVPSAGVYDVATTIPIYEVLTLIPSSDAATATPSADEATAISPSDASPGILNRDVFGDRTEDMWKLKNAVSDETMNELQEWVNKIGSIELYDEGDEQKELNNNLFKKKFSAKGDIRFSEAPSVEEIVALYRMSWAETFSDWRPNDEEIETMLNFHDSKVEYASERSDSMRSDSRDDEGDS